jgi:hypothetical protein
MGGTSSMHGQMRNEYKILIEKPEAKRRLRGLNVEGRIQLKRIFGKYGVRLWIGFIWFRIGVGGGLL